MSQCRKFLLEFYINLRGGGPINEMLIKRNCLHGSEMMDSADDDTDGRTTCRHSKLYGAVDVDGP